MTDREERLARALDALVAFAVYDGFKVDGLTVVWTQEQLDRANALLADARDALES